MATPDSRGRIGRRGEDLAARFLEREGMTIRAIRYRMPRGEIDIVAQEGDVVVFVEVKSRTAGTPGGQASDKIDTRKLRRICRMGEEYAQENGLSERPLRIDVVAVSFDVGCDPAILHYRDVTAFRFAPR